VPGGGDLQQPARSPIGKVVYIEPGPRDAQKTLDALILILDDEALSEAVDRLERIKP
jgi:hypothetical protein